jgi:hypothetical protein
MNKKVMWLMVGLVAAVLPAVAVADVMLTAYINGSETQVSDAFFVQQGSNYANANALTGFTWTPQVNSESEILGAITLGYMSNETIYEVNVLDVNFTGLIGSAYFNITVTVPNSQITGGAVFPTDSFIYITDGQQSITQLPSSVSLSVSGSTTLNFMVTSSSTIYIGFEVGSGAGGGTFLLSMSLVEA